MTKHRPVLLVGVTSWPASMPAIREALVPPGGGMGQLNNPCRASV
jgi:hypothetical protein